MKRRPHIFEKAKSPGDGMALVRLCGRWGGLASALQGLWVLLLAMALTAVLRKVSPWSVPQGAWGRYYSDTSLTARATVRPFQELSGLFLGRPATGVPIDGFSLRIRGWLWVPESAEYQFAALHDDGLRMRIDGSFVLDAWVPQRWPGKIARGTAQMERGWHEVELEFFDQSGLARFRVEWAGGPIPPRTIIGGDNLWKVRVPWKR